MVTKEELVNATLLALKIKVGSHQPGRQAAFSGSRKRLVNGFSFKLPRKSAALPTPRF